MPLLASGAIVSEVSNRRRREAKREQRKKREKEEAQARYEKAKNEAIWDSWCEIANAYDYDYADADHFVEKLLTLCAREALNDEWAELIRWGYLCNFDLIWIQRFEENSFFRKRLLDYFKDFAKEYLEKILKGKCNEISIEIISRLEETKFNEIFFISHKRLGAFVLAKEIVASGEFRSEVTNLNIQDLSDDFFFGIYLFRDILSEHLGRHIQRVITEHEVASGSMTGREYEDLCGKILKSKGWLVKHTPASNDQGADLIASRENLKICIQCKRYSAPVGNKAVQEVIAGKYGTTRWLCPMPTHRVQQQPMFS